MQFKRFKNVVLLADEQGREARDADVGIAGGKGYGLLFRKGKIIGKIEERDLINALLKEVEGLVNRE